MSPKLSALSALAISFYVAVAPPSAINQQIADDFSQATDAQSLMIQPVPYCDMECTTDIAEAAAMLVEYYHRKDERDKSVNHKNVRFAVSMDDGPPDLLLPPKPALTASLSPA